MEIAVSGLITFTTGIMVLFFGKLLTTRAARLRHNGIPGSVVGGILFAIIIACFYFFTDIKFEFNTQIQSWLILYFFAAIGLKIDIKTITSGGRALLVLTIASGIVIIAQNLSGIGVAWVFGKPLATGLATGSLSLVGGPATIAVWEGVIQKSLGVTDVREIATACITLGLIAAVIIGGPITRYLINSHKLKTGSAEDLTVGIPHNAEEPIKLDYHDFLYSWFWLNLAIIVGKIIGAGLTKIGIDLPAFAVTLVAGFLLNNFCMAFFDKKNFIGTFRAMSLISDICLDMILILLLMSLQLWLLRDDMVYIGVVMLLQTAFAVAFIIYPLFRWLGKSYESAVIGAGFTGVAIGSASSAMINMAAITQEYGAAQRAFVVVTIVVGFFSDILNAIGIKFFIHLFH